MSTKPFTLKIMSQGNYIEPFDTHTNRFLSAMRGQFCDQDAFEEMINATDEILYEIFEIKRPEVAGELSHGISLIHPGKVGDEYFMTKGHFHTELETAELYYCLQGSGMMLMETPEGEWAVEVMVEGNVVYVPPRWAHRSINTSPTDDLVLFFVYPGNAGHDYRTIEHQGFRKVVIERAGQPVIEDNPRWVPAESCNENAQRV